MFRNIATEKYKLVVALQQSIKSFGNIKIRRLIRVAVISLYDPKIGANSYKVCFNYLYKIGANSYKMRLTII